MREFPFDLNTAAAASGSQQAGIDASVASAIKNKNEDEEAATVQL